MRDTPGDVAAIGPVKGFPSPTRSLHPKTKEKGRHHLSEDRIQRAMKKAEVSAVLSNHKKL
jgi:hypothetical protein